MTDRQAFLAGYAALAAAMIVVQALRIRQGSLTIGRLIQWLRQRWMGRVVLLVCWAWLGWHLLARGSVAFLR